MIVKCVQCREFKAKVPKSFAKKHNIDEFVCDDCCRRAQEEFKENELYDVGLEFDNNKLKLTRGLFKNKNPK